MPTGDIAGCRAPPSPTASNCRRHLRAPRALRRAGRRAGDAQHRCHAACSELRRRRRLLRLPAARVPGVGSSAAASRSCSRTARARAGGAASRPRALMAAANERPGRSRAFTTFSAVTPRLRSTSTATRRRCWTCALRAIFETLRGHWARPSSTTSTSSAAPTRSRPGRRRRTAWSARHLRLDAQTHGDMVPLGSLVTCADSTAPTASCATTSTVRARSGRAAPAATARARPSTAWSGWPTRAAAGHVGYDGEMPSRRSRGHPRLHLPLSVIFVFLAPGGAVRELVAALQRVCSVRPCVSAPSPASRCAASTTTSTRRSARDADRAGGKNAILIVEFARAAGGAGKTSATRPSSAAGCGCGRS